VKRALAYYDWFRESGVDPILYHSRFTEPDKKRKEGKLIDALGQRAWEEGTASGVAVLTQIGEMSLNISAPIMVSDLCPYDRLAQRAGRLGRFEGMDAGTLYVVTPMKDGDLYPAPYGEPNPETYTWQPGRPLIDTREELEFQPHSAHDFIDAVDTLYSTPEDFAPSDARIEQNTKRLRQHLQQDWLIVNARTVDEDEGRTDDWMSRDILPQVTVLTECPHRFDSYADYRSFEQTCGVSIPRYQIETGKKIGRVPKDGRVEFEVADEIESAWYTPVYSRTEGLILDQKRKRSMADRSL
jgi:CRISPR-associated endonuclease/helicase Cas3